MLKFLLITLTIGALFFVNADRASAAGNLRIAAAQTAVDTGLIGDLADDFRRRHPDITIHIQSAGALATLDIGRRGFADLVITHYPEGEKLFVEDGYGLLRTQLFFNGFAIFGPPDDPLKIAGESDLVAVLQRLGREEVPFLVPGKRSGTLNKLNELWLLAGIEPEWVGYEINNVSASAALRDAALFGSYMFTGLGTYLVNRELIAGGVISLFRDNILLRNYYSAIVINANRFPQANQQLAERFLDYLVSDETQEWIRNFGIDKFGAQIYTPSADYDEGFLARRGQVALEKKKYELKLMAGLVTVFLALSIFSSLLLIRMRKLDKIRRRSEERFRLAVAGTNDGICDWDVLTDRAYFSPRLRQILKLESDQDFFSNPKYLISERIAPPDQPTILGRLESYLQKGTGDDLYQAEFRMQGIQDHRWILIRSKAIRSPTGEAVRLSGSFTDITSRKTVEAMIEHQALHDALTNLPNRALLHDRLTYAIQLAERQNTYLALLVMDLDRFKDINDTLGHQVGDKILQQVAKRLQHILRPSDTVARLGGDEFAVLLPVTDVTYANHIAQKIILVLKKVFVYERHTLYVGGSLGIAIYPDHGLDAETLIQHADVAMYLAKRGNSGCAFYDPQQDRHSVTRLALERDLHDAIDNNSLELYYQPQLDIKTQNIVGVEALLRWKHPQRGMIPPDEIIPIAEQTGLIRPLTMWVLNNALKQVDTWRRQGIQMSVSVNLSVWNIQDLSLVDELKAIFSTWSIPPSFLKLEITESAMMANPERALEVLTGLHSMNVHLSVDDFGTGFSSLAYLRKFPVSSLKIDKSFVMNMAGDENDTAIVVSTIELAHNLGLSVVAEGVENEKVLGLLAKHGCDIAQGYYLGRPMPQADITRYLEAHRGAMEVNKLSGNSAHKSGRLLS